MTLLTGARAVTLRLLIVATRRSPAVVAVLGEAERVALPDAFFAPNDWATPNVLAMAEGPGTISAAQSVPRTRRADPTAAQTGTARPPPRFLRLRRSVLRGWALVQPAMGAGCVERFVGPSEQPLRSVVRSQLGQPN
jgi:hypothetical protein